MTAPQPAGRISAAQIAAWLGPRDRVAMALCACIALVGVGVRQDWPGALPVALLAAMLAAITVIDLRHFRIPDRLSLPLIPLGAIYAAVEGAALWPRFLAMAVLWVLLTALQQGFLRLRGQAGLGGGDIKLITAAALWLPLEQLAPYLLAASGTALIQALIAALARARWRQTNQHRRIAFGAHLAPWLGLFVLFAEF